MKINLLSENTDWKSELSNGFRTERLIFKPLSDNDLKPLLEVSRDKDLFDYLDDIRQPDELEDWLKFVYKKRNYLFFSIKGGRNSNYNGVLLGVVMLNRVKKNLVEVGGWLGKEFHNMGFGSEAAKGTVQYLHQEKPGIHLLARTREDNHAAMRILDMNGIEKRVGRCHAGS